MFELLFVVMLFSLLIWGNIYMFIKCVERLCLEPNGSSEKTTHEKEIDKELKDAYQREVETERMFKERFDYMEARIEDLMKYIRNIEVESTLAEERLNELVEERAESLVKTSNNSSDLGSFRKGFVERINGLQDELDVRSSIDVSDLSEEEREMLDSYLMDGIHPSQDEQTGVEVITDRFEKEMEKRRGV